MRTVSILLITVICGYVSKKDLYGSSIPSNSTDPPYIPPDPSSNPSNLMDTSESFGSSNLSPDPSAIPSDPSGSLDSTSSDYDRPSESMDPSTSDSSKSMLPSGSPTDSSVITSASSGFVNHSKPAAWPPLPPNLSPASGSSDYNHPSGSLNLSYMSSSSSVDAKAPDTRLKDRITTIARLHTAMVMQAGIMNEEIPIEKAIGELLGFGAVPISDIIAFKSEEIVGLIEQIDSRYMGTFMTGDIIKANDLLLSYALIGDLNDFPSTKSYTRRVTEFSEKIEDTKLSKAKDPLKKIDDSLKDLVRYNITQNSDDSDKSNALASFTYIRLFIQIFKNDLKRIKEDVSTWKPYLDLADLDSSLNNLITLQQIFELHVGVKEVQDPVHIEYTRKQFDYMLGLSEIFESAKNSSLVMRNLVESRKLSSVKRIFGGVSGLILLPNEFQDEWIGKALAGAGKVHQVIDGLRPIIKLTAKLNSLDTALNPLTEYEFSSLVVAIESIRSLGKNVTSAINVDELWTKYIECHRKTDTKANHDELSSLLKNPRDLASKMRNLKWSKFLERDFQNILDELEKFWKFAGFTKDENKEELVAVCVKLFSSGKLKQMENFIGEIYASIKSFEEDEVKSSAKSIKSFSTSVESFLESSTLEKEKEVVTCMKGLEGKLQESFIAAKAIIEHMVLRNMNKIDRLQKVVSSIAQVSKELLNLNISSIVENMNKDATNATEKLNNHSLTLADSVTFTKAASLLHYSYDFPNMNSSLPLIISAKKDYFLRDSPNVDRFIDERWGDHEKFVDQLQKGLETLDEFHKKPERFNKTNLGDYGLALKALSSIPDVLAKADIVNKSEAFGLVYERAYSHSYREGMDPLRRTLDQLAQMDLQFSSHGRPLQDSEGILNNLQKSLEQFLYDVSDVVIPPDLVDDSNGTNLILIIVCSVLAAGFIGGGITVWCMWRNEVGCFKPNFQDKVIFVDPVKWPVPNSLLIQWLTTNYYPSPRQAYLCMVAFWRALKAADYVRMASTPQRLDARKHRNPAVRYCDKYPINTPGYHANKIVTQRGHIFYAMQSPMDQTETTDDTRKHFWDVMWNDNVQYIVMCSEFEENGVSVCGNYVNFGDPERKSVPKKIVIGTFTIEVKFTGHVKQETRKARWADCTRTVLCVTNSAAKKGEEKFRKVIHFQFHGWDPEGFAPNGHSACYFVLMECLMTPRTSPIAVHCPTGTGRTMQFIGFEYITREIEVNPRLEFLEALQSLAKHRAFAFQTVRQIYWVQCANIWLLCEYHNIQDQFDMFYRIFLRLTKDGEELPADHGDVIW